MVPKNAEFSKLINGFKEAMKDNVFDSEEEAKASLEEGYVIEERKGKASRCEGNYCNVAEFCSQYKEE